MKAVYFNLETPEQNLALDEALLDLCEKGQSDELLRFWESDKHFVVLGYSNKISSEVAKKDCQNDGIPILRRPSGGGTVLQGKGCLNYSLLLKISRSEDFRSLSKTNCHVLKRHTKGLTDAKLCPENQALKVQGVSDMTLEEKKISGNAQRRRKDWLLFHGTILYEFDLDLIPRYLQMPSLEPEYRQNRSHLDFVTNFPATQTQIQKALAASWDCKIEEVTTDEAKLWSSETEKLVIEKYSKTEWNEKF